MKEKILSIQNLGKCKYLGACINESLRIYPSIPIISKQTSEDIVLDGYSIQAHTPFIISDTSFSEANDLWENKEKFQPERFLNRGTIKYLNQVIPFGYGLRMWPAKNVATMISKLLVSTLFKNFNIIPLSSFKQERTNSIMGGKFTNSITIKIEKRE